MSLLTRCLVLHNGDTGVLTNSNRLKFSEDCFTLEWRMANI